MRVGYTAFLSLKNIYLSSKNDVPIQEKGKNCRSNPGLHLGLTGPFKKGFFVCVRQQTVIYGINKLCEFLPVTAVKQAMPAQVPSVQVA